MSKQYTQKTAPGHSSTPSYNFLYGRLAGDLAAAAVSATLVAPTVAIMDRAIVERISFGQSLLYGLRMHTVSALRHPGKFLYSRPFGLVWTLYAGTYAVASCAESLATEFQAAATGTITFVSTMLVNVPLGVWKDLRFARYFGASNVPSVSQPTIPLLRPKVPKAATTTFLLRDAVTIFGSFTLAPLLSAAVPDSLATNPHTKIILTQLTVPMLTQVVATPLHLLGLDLYNRHDAVTLAARFRRNIAGLPSSTVVRCIRILPAFGFGCLSNMETRAFFHKVHLESMERTGKRLI
ncbi:Fc.00g000600.m01.CDS01 [Cosmosporella sp. VM-42]